MGRVKPHAIETDHLCPTCGKPMMLRQSKRGPFLGCSGYPKCKTVLNVDENGNPVEREKPPVTEHSCPNCGKPLVRREGRRGPFLGCSGYPKCRTIVNIDEDGNPIPPEEQPKPVVSDQACPKCGKPLVERMGPRGKFLGCSGYPKCKTVVKIPGAEAERPQAHPTGIQCPKDGGEIVAKPTRYGNVY